MNEIWLSIIMPTFNKAKYIREALDSIFMQETNYHYKIIIADDGSVDATLDIVEQYVDKYPNTISVLKSEKNQGLFKNIIRAYRLLDTKYFCVLDPDDFWIDKNKIQNALDFLESHREYTIYATNMRMQYDANRIIGNYNGYSKQKSSDFQQYLEGRAVLGNTPSSIFRNIVFDEDFCQKILLKINNGLDENSFRADSFRNLSHLVCGKVFYEPIVDSVYRITEEGIWCGSDEFKRILTNCIFYKDMWLFYEEKYFKLLLISYELYKKLLKPNLLEIFFNNDEEKFIKQSYELHKLHTVYQLHIDELESATSKKMKLKYRIYHWFYEKLKKKLEKKGLI